MTTHIVGLTGGIGSGKSMVARRFKALGIEVIDVDQLARDVVAKGEPALGQIRQHFGDDILLPSGELDRRQLRQRIFEQPEEKNWLERLLHPLIRQRALQQVQNATSEYAIWESPLLLETDQYRLASKIIVVDVEEATQIARASARDGSDTEQIKRIMANQMARQEKLKKADYVINNEGSVAETELQVDALHAVLSAHFQNLNTAQ